MSVTITFVTCGSEDEAKKIAHALVQEKLAACVNVLAGVTSVFFWEGKLNEEPEYLLVIKSTAEASGRLTRRVRELHSYDVPEVVTYPVTKGNADYLRWVEGEVK